MTENDIIKVLECCSKSHCGVEKCPLNKNTANTKDCITQLSINALDLINRKNAEIERLKKENEAFAELEQGCYVTGYKKIRAEAIKEFWGKLKEQNTMDARIVSVASGDNLLKEMTGGLNNA